MPAPENVQTGSDFNFSARIRDGNLTKSQAIVILLLGVVVLFDGMDNQLLGLVAHDMSLDLGIPLSAFGIVFSLSLVGAIVGALLMTAAADQRFGRKRVVVLGMTLAGLGTIFTAHANSIEELTVIRFLTGAGLGAALPTAISLATEFSPQRYSRRVVSLMIAFVPLGSLLGGLMGRAIMPVSDWQTLLYVSGWCTLILTALTAFLVPESVNFLVRRKQDQERAIAAVKRLFGARAVRNVFLAADSKEDEERSKQPVASLFTGGMWKLTLFFWIAFIMDQAILYFVINWAPSLLLTAGMSSTSGHDAASMFGIGGAIGTLAQGWLATRYGIYKVMLGEISIYIIAMLVMPFALGNAELAPALIFIIAATICAYHAGFIMVLLESYPEAIKSTGFGWTFGVGRIGASTAPLLTGYLLSIGWTPAAIFAIAAIPGILTGIALIAVRTAILHREVGQCD